MSLKLLLKLKKSFQKVNKSKRKRLTCSIKYNNFNINHINMKRKKYVFYYLKRSLKP